MTRELIARAARELPELRRGILGTWLFGLAGAVGMVIVPVVIQRAIDQGGLAEASANPAVSVDLGYVVRITVVAAIITVISRSLQWAASVRLVRNTESALAQLRKRTFDHVHSLSMQQQRNEHSGVLIARVTSDVDALAEFANWGLRSWLTEPIVLFVTLIVIALYSPALGLVVVIAIALGAFGMSRLMPRMTTAYAKMRAAIGNRSRAFTEILGGAATVRAYGAQQWASTYASDAATAEYRYRLRTNRFMASVFIVGDLIGIVTIPIVLVVGITQRERLGLSAGELIAIMTLTFGIQTPIGILGETVSRAQDALAALRRILQILDLPTDLVEPNPGQDLGSGPVAVSVRNVSFAYSGHDPVLHDVTIDFAAGERIAIVGETGSGKSTFAQLLCRLADPTTGEIAINDVPLPEVSSRSRLAAIRMVPQDGFLFDTTIRNNIALGRVGATDEDIDRALRRLELDDWVQTLPDGLNTLVGERGANLSAGERQLVSFVRAAVADPGLLILDEATSIVDPQHDSRLTRSLATLAQQRTVVSIAHRLSTAEDADRIIVFDRGRVIEDGTHDELVNAGGRYSHLHQAWVANTGAI